MYWIEFFISAIVIILAGIRLTKYADKLSEQTSIGKAWIGILLLGFVTSLPEAVTSLFSVVSLQASDLALGNLLGSNNFNPMLFVVMDIAYRKESINTLFDPKRSHYYAAFIALIFTVFIIFELMFSSEFLFLQIGSLGLGSILILVFYFIGMKMLSGIDGVQRHEVLAETQEKVALSVIWLNILISAAVVVGGAIFLANSADEIAVQTGLGRTFVGSIFLAIVTSLPEMVVSLSALKLGAVDLAIGNIFGSNMTNLFIVGLCDIFNKTGSLYQGVSKTHIATAILSIILTLLALGKVSSKKTVRLFGVSRYSIVMTICFVIGTYLLYTLR